MNNNGQPQGQQDPAQQLQQQPYAGLVKPEQIFNLPFLSNDAKQRYHKGTADLWQKIRTSHQSTDVHQEALKRLREVSIKLSADLRAYKANHEAAGNANTRPQGPNQNQISQQARGNVQTQPAQMASQNSNAQPQGQADFPPHVVQSVQRVAWFKPPTVPDAEADNWISTAKMKYAIALREGEKAATLNRNLAATFEQYKQQGREVTDQMKQQKANAEREILKHKAFVESLMKQVAEGRAAATGQQGQPAGLVSAVGAVQPGQQVRPSIQVPNLPQSNQGRPLSSTSATGQVGAQIPVSQAGQQQFPPRPMPNPSQAGTKQTNSPQTAHPQSGHPQSGAPQPQPYTHEAAVAAASRSYTNPPQNGTPQSATAASGPTINRAETERMNTPSSSNFRIAKTLNIPPLSPVAMGPARPTLSGTSSGPMGMLGQPAIQKQPSFLLQGPGNRVLDKKKLDELVRQVTGGVDGSGGETLTPEVEESILQLADEFVDNVVTSACKLAKLRGSSQLEIRDLQLVIERQYNIRIAGFASDEIRTVRKIQPTASYLHKMNAVQAAKVMGGTKEP